MPRHINQDIKNKAIDFAIKVSQSAAAKKFGVSRMWINATINNRPIKTGSKKSKLTCPITGF